MRLVRGGKVAIKVYDQVSPLFQLLKVSVIEILYLFCSDMIVDELAMLVKKATEQDLIRALVPHPVKRAGPC
jgi:hypothetical protein